ncbi:hypothetical protein T05_2475 [Trichinella murrelli]|uniref:Uncharacterized protein n=1 Tax=Trichinella murrelli TaxID=144512 RepID=A0A0V0UD54_9BILA|nr:hypothetical protein T05_2475 [Trichinella murrelli]
MNDHYSLFRMLVSMSRVQNIHGRLADSLKSTGQQFVPCTRISASVGRLLREHLDQGRLEFVTSVQLRLALGEMACFRVHVRDDHRTTIDHNSTELSRQNSTKVILSTVYAVEYLNLVHVHPIRQQYLFAVPTINSVCVCDCAGGEDHCRPGHQYNNCTADTLCVTSYHAHQKPVGCPFGAEADLCCQISVKPYRNWIFRALYIGQPATVAKFAYRRYSINNNDQTWTLEVEQHLTVTLNEPSDFNIATDSLHFSLNGGLPHWQLKEGMYFHRQLQAPQQNANEKQRANDDDDDDNNNNKLHVGVPLNEPDEWDPNKLGWLRLENGHWIAHHGHLQLPTLQHVQVDDCKRQIYTVDYNARHSGGVGQPNFGTSVQENEPWIRRVRSQLNSVEIEHRRSPTVDVQVQINGTRFANVSVSHRDSVLSDFEASIVVDSTNNRYLNLTLHNARGMLLGTVYTDESSQTAELAFSLRAQSVQSDSSGTVHTVRLALPPEVNGSRRVCLEVNPETSVCRTANYVVQPTLKQPALAMASWSVKQGECENCNQITLQSIGKYLNPLQWFDGIGDVSEMIAVAIESLFSILVILMLLCLCRRFAWPILRLAIHPAGKSKSPGI